MEREVKVKFSSEDRNFTSGLTGVEARVAKMYEGFVKSARQYADSSKSAFQSVEEQIRNQERLYRGAFEKSKARAEYQLNAGNIDEKTYREKLSAAHTLYNDSRQITALLRELIETDKNINREALAQERKQFQENKTLDQQRHLEDRKEKDKEREEQRGNARRDARVVDLVNIMRSFVNAPNMYQGMASAVPATTALFTGNPIINAISSLIGDGLKRGYEEGAKFTRSAANIAQITGKNYSFYSSPSIMYSDAESKRDSILRDARKRISKISENYVDTKALQAEPDMYAPGASSRYIKTRVKEGFEDEYKRLVNIVNTLETAKSREKYVTDRVNSAFDEATRIGFSPAELNDMSVRYMKSVGIGGVNYDKTLDIGYLKKAFGLDEGQLMSLTRQDRVSGGSGDAMLAAQAIFDNINRRNPSLLNTGNTSLLPEYLQQLVDIGQQQLEKLGKIESSDVNSGKIAAVSGLTNNGLPDEIRQLLPKLEQGFSESQNPQIRALQFQVMSGMGETNIFNMRKMMENPLAAGNRKYIGNVIRSLKSIAGNNTQVAASYLATMMNITQTQAEDIINKSTPEGLKAFESEVGSKNSVLSREFVKSRAITSGTTDTERRTADMASAFQKMGAELLEKTEAIVKFFEEMVGDSKEINTQMAEGAKSAKKIREEVEGKNVVKGGQKTGK